MRSTRSPVLETGLASATELDELDAAALGAFRRDLARSLTNLAYRLADQGRGARRWQRPKKPSSSARSSPPGGPMRTATSSNGRCDFLRP